MAAYAPPSAPPPSPAQPPTSPDVAAQQSPVSQFLQGYQPQGEQAQAPGANAAALAAQKLNQVAADLKEVAKVLVTSKPNLMPLLQRMLSAGSMLMNELQTSLPQAQAGQAGVQRGPGSNSGAPPGGPGEAEETPSPSA